MDVIDSEILEILSQNARATAAEIGDKVNLSVPAINKRIRKLQSEGAIRKFTVVTDGKRVGKPIIAFVLVVVQGEAAVKALLDYVSADPDILECAAVTGEYDYLIKVCAADVESLEEKLLCMKKKKGVLKSHTMLSLMEYKFSPTVLP